MRSSRVAFVSSPSGCSADIDLQGRRNSPVGNPKQPGEHRQMNQRYDLLPAPTNDRLAHETDRFTGSGQPQWSSTFFAVSEFFVTKAVTSVQPYTGRPSIQPAKLSQRRSSRTSRAVSTLGTLSPAFRSERGLRAQDERKTRRRDRRHAETAFLRFLNGVPVAGSGSRRPRWQTPQGAKESTAGGARRP